MKIICISTKDPEGENFHDGYITIGKVYECSGKRLAFGSRYLIVNDEGVRTSYPSHCFKPLSEIREEKLNLILN